MLGSINAETWSNPIPSNPWWIWIKRGAQQESCLILNMTSQFVHLLFSLASTVGYIPQIPRLLLLIFPSPTLLDQIPVLVVKILSKWYQKHSNAKSFLMVPSSSTMISITITRSSNMILVQPPLEKIMTCHIQNILRYCTPEQYP